MRVAGCFYLLGDRQSPRRCAPLDSPPMRRSFCYLAALVGQGLAPIALQLFELACAVRCTAGLVMKFFFRSQEIALPAPKREMMMFEHPDPPPGTPSPGRSHSHSHADENAHANAHVHAHAYELALTTPPRACTRSLAHAHGPRETALTLGSALCRLLHGPRRAVRREPKHAPAPSTRPPPRAPALDWAREPPPPQPSRFSPVEDGRKGATAPGVLGRSLPLQRGQALTAGKSPALHGLLNTSKLPRGGPHASDCAAAE